MTTLVLKDRLDVTRKSKRLVKDTKIVLKKKKQKISTYFPAGRRRPADVTWRSPKCHNVRDFQGTFRDLLGDQHKTWWFNENKCFLDGIVFILYIYICFYWKNKYSKVLNGDVYGTQLRDVLGTKCWDVLGTFAGHWTYMFFKSNSETY